MAISSVNSKRTFEKIREEILLCLSKGQMTVNEIATSAGINWKTVDNHLVYLTGRGFVKEIFSSAYVRIYELTVEGKDFLIKNALTIYPKRLCPNTEDTQFSKQEIAG